MPGNNLNAFTVYIWAKINNYTTHSCSIVEGRAKTLIYVFQKGYALIWKKRSAGGGAGRVEVQPPIMLSPNPSSKRKKKKKEKEKERKKNNRK